MDVLLKLVSLRHTLYISRNDTLFYIGRMCLNSLNPVIVDKLLRKSHTQRNE